MNASLAHQQGRPAWAVTEKDGEVCLTIFNRSEVFLTPDQAETMARDLIAVSMLAKAKGGEGGSTNP